MSEARMDWEKRYAAVERDYADYVHVLEEAQKRTGYCGAHCDQFVLHAPPDNCKYCNELFADLQSFRLHQRIAFTGHPAPKGWRPCPAEVMRPTEMINRWHGNVAMTPEMEQAMERYYSDLRRALSITDEGDEKDGKQQP